MSERTALILAFTGAIALEAVVLGGLALAGADSNLLVMAYVLLLIGGSCAVSLVVTHYRS
jgi:hypothetical protein